MLQHLGPSPASCGNLPHVSPTHEHNRIDYIELSVTDLAAAKAFYSAAFDWSFNDYGPGYAGIRASTGDTEDGGLCLADEVTAGGPLVVLYSNDLDATVTRVTTAGGRIVKESFDFPGGRRFHFADPSGNILAVWTTPA